MATADDLAGLGIGLAALGAGVYVFSLAAKVAKKTMPKGMKWL